MSYPLSPLSKVEYITKKRLRVQVENKNRNPSVKIPILPPAFALSIISGLRILVLILALLLNP